MKEEKSSTGKKRESSNHFSFITEGTQRKKRILSNKNTEGER